MNDLNSILVPLVPFVLGIIFKTILDFNLAFFIIKYFHWIPVRSLFRSQPQNIAGEWLQLWENNDSDKYLSNDSRKSKIHIRQFGKYIYGEFRSKNDEEYYVFGEVMDRNIVGKWSDRNSKLGYYGAFELRIVDNNNLNGVWLGHSNITPNKINFGDWSWNR